MFELEDLSQINKEIVHAQRLTNYPAMSTHQTLCEERIEQAQHLQSTYHFIEHIVDIGERKSEYELLVSWLRWEEDDDTWESLKTLLDDVP